MYISDVDSSYHFCKIHKIKMGASKLFLKISFTALFAAFTAAGAFIAIPIGPVPIVLQNLFALLSGLILGPIMGGASVCLFLFAGILNFPVFSGGTGGIARFAGPTGGFLAGYFLAAVTAGSIAGRPRPDINISLPRMIAAVIAGFLVVYVPGLAWLKISRNLSWGKAFLAGFAPFIIGDILKGFAAVLIAPRLRRIAADHLNG
jgi:biotin transport system substrate-specific component